MTNANISDNIHDNAYDTSIPIVPKPVSGIKNINLEPPKTFWKKNNLDFLNATKDIPVIDSIEFIITTKKNTNGISIIITRSGDNLNRFRYQIALKMNAETAVTIREV
jgi:hypothetical protein